MRNSKMCGLFVALIAGLIMTTPALAQYLPNSVMVNPGYGPAYNPYAYANPYYAPCYNNYCYRGYAPYGGYGYHHYRTARNMAVGASIGAAAGAAIGLLASHHGHHYYY
jgi:hypothetical protein